MIKQDTLLDQLSHLLSKLPGLGPRSARRITLELIKKKHNLFLPLIQTMQDTAEQITTCELCGNLDLQSPCQLCAEPKRDIQQICIVEDVIDLWAIERAHIFKGRYHVLGGTLSAIDGVGPEQLSVPKLLSRIESEKIEEVIFATSATLDGQTTSHYILEALKPYQVKTSRIAYGVPMGGELDYLDEGTLVTAFQSRSSL